MLLAGHPKLRRNLRSPTDDILVTAAMDLPAARLRTPLQIEQNLTLAPEPGYQASEKPVGEGVVDFRRSAE